MLGILIPLLCVPGSAAAHRSSSLVFQLAPLVNSYDVPEFGMGLSLIAQRFSEPAYLVGRGEWTCGSCYCLTIQAEIWVMKISLIWGGAMNTVSIS